jgi:UDP-N-acetylglucosamine 2-epimerase (non-hydrolysing)
LGKAVLVMRDTTERPEAVNAGTVRLVGTEAETIVSETTHLLIHGENHQCVEHAHNPYGDGFAANRICDVIVQE